ncbi:MAG: tyrosine-type recombinase/integrase, partial [Streptosporangiales bacterium]|nr:tyrosine-type recombinase/integrase [Streptosporangiales bacterium]
MEVQRAPTGVKGITKITYESGEVRYRVVVDAGPDPKSGKRRQLTFTRRTLKEAKSRRNETLVERDKGTLVMADKTLTVEQACETWLAGKRKLAPDSRRTYREELKQVTRALGAVPVQSLTKEHVEQLVDAMQDGTARRIGRRGQPLSPASIKMVVGRLAQVLDSQVKQGNLARNVARLVELPELPKRADHKAWTVDETRQFLKHVQSDRLFACWLLSLHGLRRHEVLGLAWDAVDLDTETLNVRKSKTRAGERELPLTPVLVPTLKAHRRQLTKERLVAGEAYVVGDALVSPAGNSCDISCEGVEDFLRGLLPHERFRVLVPHLDPFADVFLQC